MSDPLKAILESAAALANPRFPATSRYHRHPTATVELDDGRTVRYLSRRFAPQPEVFAITGEHEVTEGERLDHVAARELGAPELFWRLCDANRALRAEELERVGRRLRLPLPEGVPGPVDE